MPARSNPKILKTLNLKPELRKLRSAILLLSVVFVSCGKEKEKRSAETKDPLTINYEVRTQWPHDTQAFIQGLVIHDGKLYESTGQEGHSWIGIVDVSTGKADRKVTLGSEYFGEGITILNNKIYQLTWKHKVGFIYDLKTFKKLGEFPYDTEGWGLTHNNQNLIMSNGTNKLIFLDTTSLKPLRTLNVTDDAGPVDQLNELEFVEGYIMANVWNTNMILRIDPGTGKVVGKLDLSALSRDAKLRDPNSEVLNGIAYHPTTKLLLITGKNWPMIYVLHLKK